MLKKWNRLGASVIDNSLIILIVEVLRGILFFLFGSILAIRGGGQPIELLYDFLRVLFLLFFVISIAVGYCMLCYRRYDRTLGQILLRVHVVDKSSKDNKLVLPTTAQLFKRECYKWTLSISTFYIYAFFCIFYILLGRELFHNKVANTRVEVWV